jgi:cytochrome c
MAFAGLKKPDERANVIAYLRTLADSPVPLPEAPAATAPTATTPAAGGAAAGGNAAMPGSEGGDAAAGAMPETQTPPADSAH